MDVTEWLLMPEEGDILLQGSGNVSPVAKLLSPVKGLARQSGRGRTHVNIGPVRGGGMWHQISVKRSLLWH